MSLLGSLPRLFYCHLAWMWNNAFLPSAVMDVEQRFPPKRCHPFQSHRGDEIPSRRTRTHKHTPVFDWLRHPAVIGSDRTFTLKPPSTGYLAGAAWLSSIHNWAFYPAVSRGNLLQPRWILHWSMRGGLMAPNTPLSQCVYTEAGRGISKEE